MDIIIMHAVYLNRLWMYRRFSKIKYVQYTMLSVIYLSLLAAWPRTKPVSHTHTARQCVVSILFYWIDTEQSMTISQVLSVFHTSVLLVQVNYQFTN